MKRIFVLLLSLLILSINLVSSKDITIECKTGKESNSCVNNVAKIEEKYTKVIKPTNEDYTELHIRSTYVNFLPANLNEAFPKLQILKVFNSSLLEINKENFDELFDLTKLEFSKNSLTTLQSDTFENLINLEKIDLSGNQIKYLHGTTFSRNLKLVEIVISNNQLETLNDKTFKKLTKLKILDLSHNFIEDFNSGTFKDCKELKRFDFSHNNLKHSPEDIFDGLEKLIIDRKHIRKNKCIEDYESFHSKNITNKIELKEAFKETCKPSNQEKLDELYQEIRKLSEENKELKKKFETCENDLKKSKTKVEELEEEKKDCDEKLTEKTEEAETFDEIRTNLETKNENQEKEIKELKEISKNSNNSNENLTQELYKLQISYTNLDIKYNNIKNTSLIYGNELKQMTEKFDNEKKKAELCDGNLNILQEKSQKLSIEKDEIEESLKICKQNVTECNQIMNINFAKIFELGKKCGLNEPAPISVQNAQILFDIPCIYEKLDLKNFPKFYSCSISNFVNLNCNSKLNEISGTHSSIFNDDKNVESLNIQDTSIVASTLRIFEKFKNLKLLKIQESTFGNFEFQCDKIEIIDIKKSIIGEEFEISECLSLKKLTIESTNLKIVKSSQKILSLIEIILRNNKIEVISVDFFMNFKNLEFVDLSQNKISQLDGNTFDHNPNLETLKFSDNQLKEVDGEIFNKNRNLNILIFQNSGCINKSGSGSNKIFEIKAEIKKKCK